MHSFEQWETSDTAEIASHRKKIEDHAQSSEQHKESASVSFQHERGGEEKDLSHQKPKESENHKRDVVDSQSDISERNDLENALDEVVFLLSSLI